MPAMESTLRLAEDFAADLATLAGPPPEPRFDQEWFPRLDAAVLYALVRGRRPRHLVEIGSGHSTRFAARAARDAGGVTEIVCIDPQPRARLDGLGVRTIPATVQAAADAGPIVAGLAAGDVLFVDSSHVAMPGTDVDLVLNTILPALAPGVLVHVHDIFLPDPYPEAWAWRGYNEQVAVGALLQGGAYEILFASHYLGTREAERVRRSPLAALPLAPGVPESSLWLVKRA